MRLRRLLRPAPHLERDTAQHALLVLIGAGLALAAVIGIAWAAGFERVYDELRAVDPIWLPVAFGMEVAAYFGYVVAYREVARAKGGPQLGLGRAGAIVAAGFGETYVWGQVIDQMVESARDHTPTQLLVLFGISYLVIRVAMPLLDKLLWYCNKLLYYFLVEKFELLIVAKKGELDLATHEDPASQDMLTKVRENGAWKIAVVAYTSIPAR